MDENSERRERELPTVPHDDAMDMYIDKALERTAKGIDLLMAAEEAYTRSKACKPEKSKDKDEWRKRRDGFLAEGNIALYKAQDLLLGKEVSE